MEITLYLVYLGLCALIGYFGRNRRLGTIAYFLLSLFLSPFIGAVIVIASGPKKTPSSDAS